MSSCSEAELTVHNIRRLKFFSRFNAYNKRKPLKNNDSKFYLKTFTNNSPLSFLKNCTRHVHDINMSNA